MKKLYWLHYNNYYNRILKVGDTLSDYLGVDNANVIHVQEDANLWNPNDGIATTVKAGGANKDADFSREPDYFIAVGENDQIDSRWFVIENRRIRKGQYSCVLKRDVFADDLQNFKQATCNIKRGLLNRYDTRIYNDENIKVNQILTDETFIKDSVGCPWIILYAATDILNTNLTGSVAVNDNYDILWTESDDIDDFVTKYTFIYAADEAIQAALNIKSSDIWGHDHYKGICFLNNDYIVSGGAPAWNVLSVSQYSEYLETYTNQNAILSAIRTDYSIKTPSYAESIKQFDGLRVKYTDSNNVDHIVVVHKKITNAPFSTHISSSNDTFDELETERNDNGLFSGTTINPHWYSIHAKSWQLTFTYEEIDLHTVNYSFNNTGYIPDDAPYFIWAIPYGDITIKFAGTDYAISKEIGLAVANRVIQTNSTSAIYDCQIVPYCPLPDQYLTASGINIVTADPKLTSTTTIYHTDNGVDIPDSFIFNVQHASFKRQCNLSQAITITDPKLECTKDLYRIYSPNYASSFEFSPAKNGGLTGFNIRCTYMPFNPYIRIAPIWGGLYGSSRFEEDVKGLICAGDYSLARVSDAWVTYQEQNKNYDQIFNRQITNMDVMHKYDRVESIAGAITGAVGAGAVGAISSATMGIIGGAGSAVAGIADVVLGELRHAEQKQYARDMHTLQLDNVQAMPKTISRTTAYTIDNRYYPVLAYYTCSQRELAAVENYFIENSFRIDSIDKPAQYMLYQYNMNGAAGLQCRGYLSGQIIKINTDKDTHYINELNSEFVKGVYMR